ncbi:histone deacetylase family protein [Enterovirga sp.]|jgi:acetoin utilization deacetylase AcuC-like enzyme|uniref:histone deacetylase family protein n=1 Tax=Enterovirga sp. TaxID=2026350 RepID=UPI00261A2348|nr:histone deacetylase family protein [Enterovirga sp.]MDB5589907.1 acetoin utilization protein [Enterovirga sp.]
MTTLLLHHEAACIAHATPAGHPERPDRIRAVATALGAERFAALRRELAPEATLEEVALAHPLAWVEAIAKANPASGLVQVDSDTIMSPGTLEAILRGAGAAVAATDAVMTGAAANAFCAMRPPGHHAERTRAMGFCFFNNAAIAARHAQTRHGAERVAIMDFDVHHGNGTQDIFWSDPTVLYASTHQMPLYPGTGAVSERGDHDTIVNAPLRPGQGGVEFREAMTAKILPRIEAFGPDLVVISAGFDAHKSDPLGSLRFEADDFAWATRELMAIAARHAGGRVVSVLEGGYDLRGLAESCAAHVAALMEG